MENGTPLYKNIPTVTFPSMEKSASPFNNFMQPNDSIPAKKWHKVIEIDQQVKFQKTPYSNPTQISKGVTSSTGRAGSFTLYDATGGTKLFDYNPVTGVITIAGSLVFNQVNSGTYSNIIIAGTSSNVGTLSNGVYANALFSGGTINNATLGTPAITGGTMNGIFQSSGTAGLTASVAFVRSVSPGTVLGTLTFAGGILIGTA